jgi:hypothetical protein
MKPRIIISLLGVILAIALVAGGFTLAWFTDEAVPPASPTMTTGTVDFEIKDAEFNPGPGVWMPGKCEKSCKEFSWTLTNTGSKRAFFRARLIEKIETIKVGCETAWGEGTRFKKKGNWGMYFTYNGSPKSVKLMAGQHQHAGWVKVGVDDKGLFVKYETINGWLIKETHLEVKKKLGDIPQNPGGPVPGRFTYKNSHAFVTEYTYRPAANASGTLYIAAHAVVVKATSITETAAENVEWKLTDGAGTSWVYNPADKWWYYCRQPVMPGEEITLDLTACLDSDVPMGVYTVELAGEAVQATHSAINQVWPNNPCGLP